jgi:TonB family protein
MSARRVYLHFFLLFALLAAASLPAAAQEDLKRARRHYERGRKLYRGGQTAAAIEALYTALSIHETYLEAQLLLARALIGAERPREAFATLRAFDFHHWHTATVQKLFGQAFYQMNKLTEADHALQYAISLAPRRDHELHYSLGLVKLRQGETESALREASRALAINPRFALAHKLLSDAYLMQREPRRAEQELVRYLRSVRQQPEAEYLKKRLAVIRSLAQARSEQAAFAAPRVHTIPEPSYTAAARRNRIEGVVRMEVLFGSDGHIQQALVVQGLGFGLDEEATRAAQEIAFTPAQLDEQPISVWGIVNFRFRISTEGGPAEKKESKNAIYH